MPDETLAGWVAGQDPSMLRALNQVAVRPGDAILVPAGLPHAIGAGVFIVELQEPTDLSVLLEWDAFPADGRAEIAGRCELIRCLPPNGSAPDSRS